MARVPRKLLSCASGLVHAFSPPGRSHQDASEGSGGAHGPAGSGLLQSAIPNGEGDGGLETRHRSLSAEWIHNADEVLDGGGCISSKFDSLGRLDVLRRSQRCVFPNSNPSGVSIVSAIQSRGPCVPVLSIVLRSFHGSASFHQSLCSGFGVGTSEGRASPPLLGRLAGGYGVEGPSSSPSGPSSPVVRLSGNCHQLGEVGPTAVDLSSVSRHDDEHILRTGLSFAGLSSSLPGGGFVVPAPSVSFSAYVASLERFLPRGCTHMWPLQWHLKDSWSPVTDDPATPIPLSQTCVEAVRWWLQEERRTSGVPLQVQPPSLSLYIDASLAGWEAHILDLTDSGVWSEEESQEHINVLEMREMELALAAFLPQLAVQCAILMSNNSSVVAYLRRQGDTVSEIMSDGVHHHSVWLEARYIPGKNNILADQLSRPDQILPTEWSLLLGVVEEI